MNETQTAFALGMLFACMKANGYQASESSGRATRSVIHSRGLSPRGSSKKPTPNEVCKAKAAQWGMLA